MVTALYGSRHASQELDGAERLFPRHALLHEGLALTGESSIGSAAHGLSASIRYQQALPLGLFQASLVFGIGRLGSAAKDKGGSKSTTLMATSADLAFIICRPL